MTRPLLQVLLALTLVLAANYFWDPRPALQPDQATSKRQVALPQTYIDGARSRAFDEQGNLSDIVEAERARYFKRGDFSALEQPRFYSHSEDDKTWSASAERGRVEHAEDRLLLRRNVVLSHDQTGTRMETSALEIELDTRMARSEKRVKIVQDKNRTIADGMVASLDRETLLVKPNVEGTYVPSPRATQPE